MLKLFMKKLTNIYIYIYGLRQNKYIQEGRLFTNKIKTISLGEGGSAIK